MKVVRESSVIVAATSHPRRPLTGAVNGSFVTSRTLLMTSGRRVSLPPLLETSPKTVGIIVLPPLSSRNWICRPQGELNWTGHCFYFRIFQGNIRVVYVVREKTTPTPNVLSFFSTNPGRNLLQIKALVENGRKCNKNPQGDTPPSPLVCDTREGGEGVRRRLQGESIAAPGFPDFSSLEIFC